MKRDDVIVNVVADTKDFDVAMKGLKDSTREFGKIFSSTISSSIKSGKGFEDTLKNIGKRFADLALKKAMAPLDNLFGNLLGSVLGGNSGGGGIKIPGFANGAAFSNQGVIPFARGGIVSDPTLFNFGSQLGVMGERGPEAVMPLSRGSDGRLGVAAPGAAKPGVNVVFNVQATDAGSFRKSESQLTTMLARVVNRGQRGL